MKRQVIVIGAGLGGLSAAIYARLIGYEVLVLEKHAVAGGKAARVDLGEYRLDPGPSIVILKSVYERMFADCGRNIDDYLRFRRLDPLSRVFFEGQPPFDLPGNRDECIRSLETRFPADAARFKWLMSLMDGITGDVDRTVFAHPIDHPWQLMTLNMVRIGVKLGVPRKYKDLIDAWFKSPVIRAFFYGFPSYSGQTYDSVSPGAFFIPYFMVSQGAFYPEGGVSAIPESLYRLATELGVRFQFNCAVEGIFRDRRRVRGVAIRDGVIECDAIISNVDRFTTGAWLGRKYSQKPSLSYFTLHWGIRREMPALAHHTLLIPEDFERGFEQLYRVGRFPESPIVYLNATHVEDPSTAPCGCSNLLAVATSPAIAEGVDWQEEAVKAKRGMMATMAKFGFEVSPSEIDFERTQTPQYFAEEHGNYLGSLYGPDEKERLFGMMPNRNWDEEYENLLYCGGSVQPGAGLPMVILSGKFAAERLARAVPS